MRTDKKTNEICIMAVCTTDLTCLCSKPLIRIFLAFAITAQVDLHLDSTIDKVLDVVLLRRFMIYGDDFAIVAIRGN